MREEKNHVTHVIGFFLVVYILAFLCGHFSSAEASGVYHSLANLFTLSRIHHGSIQHSGLPPARQVHEGEWETSWLQPSGVLSKHLCQQVRGIISIISLPLFLIFSLSSPLLSPSTISLFTVSPPFPCLSSLILSFISPFNFIFCFTGGWLSGLSLLATWSYFLQRCLPPFSVTMPISSTWGSVLVLLVCPSAMLCKSLRRWTGLWEWPANWRLMLLL